MVKIAGIYDAPMPAVLTILPTVKIAGIYDAPSARLAP